jgi:hypothetical protein
MKFRRLTPAETHLALARTRLKTIYPGADDDQVAEMIRTVPTHYGMKLTDYVAVMNRRVFSIFDDFDHYTDGTIWTKGVTSSGAVAAQSHINGWLNFASSTTQYSEAWIKSTNANYILTAGMPLMYECRLNYQEANTNECNIFAGVCDSFATALIANGGDVASSFNGVGIYKIAGSTVWKTVSSNGTTQNKNTSTQTTLFTATTPAGDQILRIAVNPVPNTTSATICEVTYFVNDVQLRIQTSAGNTYPIKDEFTFPSTALRAGFYVQGGSTTAESVNLDYLAIENLRTGTT